MTFHADCLIRTGFDSSCKLETICMKCLILFSGKTKKNIIRCCLLKFLTQHAKYKMAEYLGCLWLFCAVRISTALQIANNPSFYVISLTQLYFVSGKIGA